MVYINVNHICRGMVILMPDKNPTGNVKQHNYVVLSDINSDTEKVICFGITSCKTGNYKDVIPLKCTNGNLCYINPNNFYTFSLDEFSKGTCHGVLEDKFSNLLQHIYMLKTGLVKNSESREKIKEDWKKLSIDINSGAPSKQPQPDTTPNNDDKQTDDINSKSSTSPTHEINKRLKNWTDDELNKIVDLIEKKDYESVMRICGLKTKSGYYQKRDKILNEVERRKQKTTNVKPSTVPSSFTIAIQYNVGFWKDDDLIRYKKTYSPNDENGIAKEMGIPVQKYLSLYSRVIKEIYRRGLKIE